MRDTTSRSPHDPAPDRSGSNSIDRSPHSDQSPETASGGGSRVPPKVPPSSTASHDDWDDDIGSAESGSRPFTDIVIAIKCANRLAHEPYSIPAEQDDRNIQQHARYAARTGETTPAEVAVRAHAARNATVSTGSLSRRLSGHVGLMRRMAGAAQGTLERLEKEYKRTPEYIDLARKGKKPMTAFQIFKVIDLLLIFVLANAFGWYTCASIVYNLDFVESVAEGFFFSPVPILIVTTLCVVYEKIQRKRGQFGFLLAMMSLTAISFIGWLIGMFLGGGDPGSSTSPPPVSEETAKQIIRTAAFVAEVTCATAAFIGLEAIIRKHRFRGQKPNPVSRRIARKIRKTQHTLAAVSAAIYLVEARRETVDEAIHAFGQRSVDEFRRLVNRLRDLPPDLHDEI